jgi:hypothetical protein
MTKIVPSENSRTFVHLKITSITLTSEEIRQHVGIEPDKAWRRGELKGYPASSAVPRKNAGWLLNSGLREDEGLEAHIERLLARVEPYAGNIKELATENDVTLSCAIYLYREDECASPPLYFEQTTVAAICALGASFDIQLYFLGDSSDHERQ